MLFFTGVHPRANTHLSRCQKFFSRTYSNRMCNKVHILRPLNSKYRILISYYFSMFSYLLNHLMSIFQLIRWSVQVVPWPMAWPYLFPNPCIGATQIWAHLQSGWQLCATMMSWVPLWVELVVYFQIQRFFVLFAEKAKSFLKFLLFPFS